VTRTDAIEATARRASVPARLVSLPIRGWRVVSTRLPSQCRFHPSCSAYALEALEVHGAARGTWLAVRRIGRCHPWNPGGIDPVPQRRPRTERTFPRRRPEAA
jgi:putative membrane protein insertion efficiency factor